MKKDAMRIFRASLEAADPGRAVSNAVRRIPVQRYERVIVLGAGKASATMAKAAERELGARITCGLLNTKYGHTTKLRRIELNECGHPVPDARGQDGARRIAELARGAGAKDLVLCLISGGGSALMPLPAEGITLEEKQATTKLLLGCGATIHELNAVRKHISGIKGGQLARLAAPATIVTLMLSDVVGDPPDVIGSGPTVPDASTFAAVMAVFEKYGIRDRVPASVRARVEAGLRGEIPETPKAGEACFARTQNLIVGSNRLAVDAAVRRAKELGYRALVLSTCIEGETREVALMHAAIAREAMTFGRPVRPPACVISGGETTVTIKGDGLGGRNQEFVLAVAIALDGLDNIVVFSAGTDGTDGPTDAAGAVADGHTAGRARALGVDPVDALARNDSYRFFGNVGGLVKTGPTGTNVMDVRLMLIGPPGRPRK